jgi:hypothetical protein
MGVLLLIPHDSTDFEFQRRGDKRHLLGTVLRTCFADSSHDSEDVQSCSESENYW